MPRLTQLQTQITANGYTGDSVWSVGDNGIERLAIRSGLAHQRIRNLLGIRGNTLSMDVADVEEEKRLESALSVAPGGLR